MFEKIKKKDRMIRVPFFFTIEYRLCAVMRLDIINW